MMPWQNAGFRTGYLMKGVTLGRKRVFITRQFPSYRLHLSGSKIIIIIIIVRRYSIDLFSVIYTASMRFSFHSFILSSQGPAHIRIDQIMALAISDLRMTKRDRSWADTDMTTIWPATDQIRPLSDLVYRYLQVVPKKKIGANQKLPDLAYPFSTPLITSCFF